MDNTSLLVCQTSVPLGIDIYDFFYKEFYVQKRRVKSQDPNKKSRNTELSGLFYEYRKAQILYSLDKPQEDSKYLYKPAPFFIFGSYDLAILSVVDDFALGNRILNPLHTYRNHKTHFNYKYHVISGLYNQDVNSNVSLMDFAKGSFLRNNFDKPWIGITRCKINSGLTLGVGLNVIQYIQKYLSFIVNEDQTLGEYSRISINSFDGYEITAIIFCKSYQLLEELVTNIRSLTIEKLCEKCSIKQELFHNSILANRYSKEDIGKFKFSHIFTSTDTTVGISLKYLNKKFPIKNNLNSFTLIDVKPGHLEEIYKKFKTEDLVKIYYTHGKDSLLVEGKSTISSLSDLIYFKIANKKKLCKNIVSIKTHIINEIINSPKENGQHPFFLTDELANIPIGFKEIKLKSLCSKLCSIGFPKAVTDRITRMLGDYNHFVKDPHLFSYFGELHCFVSGLEQYIQINVEQLRKLRHNKQRNPEDITLSEIHEFISTNIDRFEKAFYCRLHQSYNFPEISDINLEFNGGVQNLLSGYNEAYSSITMLIAKLPDKNLSESYVVVSSEMSISSSWSRIRINYHQLFHPELFFSAMTKEALNQLYRSQLDEIKYLKKDITPKIFQDFRFLLNELPIGKKTKEILLDFIKSDGVEYFMIDYLNYRLGFNFDFGQYYYWHMIYMIQSPEEFIDTSTPDPTVFVTTMFRMLTVLHTEVDTTVLKQYLKDIENRPFDNIVSSLWTQYVPDLIKIFSEKFKVAKSISENREKISIMEEIFKTAMQSSDELLARIIYAERNDSLLSKNEVIIRRRDEINQLKNKYIKELSLGHYIPYRDVLPTIHIHSLSIAYLSLVSPEYMMKTELSSQDVERKIQLRKFVLFRDYNGIPINYLDSTIKGICRENSYSFLADPQGGIFINTHFHRREYLKIRSAVIASLLDFALIQKRRYFN